MLYASIAVKLVIGLAALFIVLRLLGKKELSQATPFDFIYTLVLGGILEEAIYDDKVSVFHILFAVALWGALIYFIEILVERNDAIKKPLKGEPSTLIEKGSIKLDEMKKNHMEMEQLRGLLREQGIFAVSDVYYAILETSGTISVLRKKGKSGTEQPEPSVMLIDDGVIHEHGLRHAKKTSAWLKEQLQKQGMPSPEEIFYAEWCPGGGFYIQQKKKQKK